MGETEVAMRLRADNDDGWIQPERMLWISVIILAIEDASRIVRKQLDIYNRDRAKFWLFKDDCTGQKSLYWICNELDIDLESVRSLARRVIAGEKSTLFDKRSQREGYDH